MDFLNACFIETGEQRLFNNSNTERPWEFDEKICGKLLLKLANEEFGDKIVPKIGAHLLPFPILFEHGWCCEMVTQLIIIRDIEDLYHAELLDMLNLVISGRSFFRFDPTPERLVQFLEKME